MGFQTSEIRPLPLARQEGERFVAATAASAIAGLLPLSRYLYLYLNHSPGTAFAPLQRNSCASCCPEKDRAGPSRRLRPPPREGRGAGNGFGCPRPWRTPRPQEEGEIDGGTGAGPAGRPPHPPGGFAYWRPSRAIFLYLLWATLPLLQEASQTPFGKLWGCPNAAPLLALDSRGDYLIQLDGTGYLTLQVLATGETVFARPWPSTAPGPATPGRGRNGHLYAVLLESGALQFFALEFPVRVNEGGRAADDPPVLPLWANASLLPGGVSGNRLQSFWEETQLTLAYISETEGPNGTATLHLLAFDEVELGLPLLPGRHYRYPLARAPERLARRGQQWLFLDYGDRLEAWFARFADSAEPAASLKLSPATPRSLLFGGGRHGSWGRPMARSDAPFPFGIAPAGSAEMPAL